MKKWTKNEDGPNNKDFPENEDNLKNDDKPKNERDSKQAGAELCQGQLSLC